MAAARYFVVTGKEDDAKAALEAEASLKNAIEQAIKGVTEPTRLEGFNKLARDCSNFSATFAKILETKRDIALIVKNQLQRNADLFTYKLGDIGRDTPRRRRSNSTPGRSTSNSKARARRRRTLSLTSTKPLRKLRWRD